MKKFITCLFLVCGLAAKAAVYSNQFTAIANPGTITPLVPPLLISNQSSVSIKIITGNPQFTGDLSFLNNGHIWSFGASTNTFSLASSGAESGTIFSANSLTDTIQIGGSDYPNVSLSKLTISGTAPGQLYLNGTNNGALGLTLNSNAVTTNIFLFDLRSVLAGQIIFAHSTNTLGTTNFIVMTNGWASNAFGGAFIASANGNGTNTTLRSIAGGPSLALTVDTNVLVVTNSRVGIGTNAPDVALSVHGDQRVTGVGTFGSAVFNGNSIISSSAAINWSGSSGLGADSGGPNFYGSGFTSLPRIQFGTRTSNDMSFVFSNTPPQLFIRDGTATNMAGIRVGSSMGRTNWPLIAYSGALPLLGTVVWGIDTNGIPNQRTNAAPANVTIGVTVADQWFKVRTLEGVEYFFPAWTAH